MWDGGGEGAVRKEGLVCGYIGGGGGLVRHEEGLLVEFRLEISLGIRVSGLGIRLGISLLRV